MDTAFTQVAVRKLRKHYGRVAALRGVSFELRGGEIALLMGPNGAGKSTLLTILSTLSSPTRGEVLFGDHGHTHAQRHLRAEIGVLSHRSMLYETLTCRENLLFFGKLYQLDDLSRRVESWLDRVGMTPHADKNVAELSRGMLQRVALARALLHRPRLLLLDEPFTGLDQDAVGTLREILEQQRTEQRIVLVISHDLQAMEGLCDQVLVLRGGQIVENPDLPLNTLRTNPSHAEAQ